MKSNSFNWKITQWAPPLGPALSWAYKDERSLPATVHGKWGAGGGGKEDPITTNSYSTKRKHRRTELKGSSGE